MKQHTRAQVATMKNLVIVLLVIVLMIAFSGKLFNQANNQIRSEFDPEQFYNNNDEGEDVVVSSLQDLLPQQEVEDVAYVQKNVFASAFKDIESYPKGQLVLLSSLSKQNSFFDKDRKDTTLALRAQSSSQGITLFLVEAFDEVERTSTVSSYNDVAYLKGKKICLLPVETYAPLLYEITGMSTEQETFATGITLATLAENYQLSSLELSSAGSSDSSVNPKSKGTILVTGKYASTTHKSLAGKTASIEVYASDFDSAIEGLLAWVYEDTLCFIDVARWDEAITLRNANEQEPNIKGTDKPLSSLLVAYLRDNNFINVVS